MLPALECLLIADDLTGACDAAVHFAIHGHPSAAQISVHRVHTDSAVVAVSTESRDSGHAAIVAAITEAAALWSAHPPRVLFKKIDSMLRGKAGVEIRALMEAFEYDAAVITPAYPALGRIVQNGWLRVSGDPAFEPLDVASWLRSQGLEQCVRALPDEIALSVLGGARWVVADAVHNGDLDGIVADVMRLDGRVLWVGSGGLAAALARALPAGHCKQTTGQMPAAPVLFCVGSGHKVSMAQQQALVAGRRTTQLAAKSATPACVGLALQRGEHVLLHIDREVPANHIRELVAEAPPCALLLSGGDTASLVCRALNAQSIELLDEIAPGLPRGVLRGGDLDGRAVVTKSGAFGDSHALIRVADYFSCHKN